MAQGNLENEEYIDIEFEEISLMNGKSGYKCSKCPSVFYDTQDLVEHFTVNHTNVMSGNVIYSAEF